MARKPKPSRKSRPKTRSSLTRTFKVDPGSHAPPGLYFTLGTLGKNSLLNGAMIGMSTDTTGPAESDSTLPPSAGAESEGMTGECTMGTVQVDLKEVQYTGDDLLVPEWRVNIHFEILPHGVITDTAIPHMVFDSEGKYTVLTPIYNGPGILCGQDCLPSTLIFHVRATGTGTDGVEYVGVADAIFLQSPTPDPIPLSVGVKVKEPPLIPPPIPPRPPREADLWFLFLVATTC